MTHCILSRPAPFCLDLRPMRRIGILWLEPCGLAAAVVLVTLSTNLVATHVRVLADMIETLPVSLAPEHQYERCCELLEQVAIALDRLVTD